MAAITQHVSSMRLEAYVGDPETGLVHRHRLGCSNIWGVFFLSLETALVYDYRLCTCVGSQNRAEAS